MNLVTHINQANGTVCLFPLICIIHSGLVHHWEREGTYADSSATITRSSYPSTFWAHDVSPDVAHTHSGSSTS